jgi:hypothetical protein
MVVRRFLERLGSSATAIEDCWALGRLGPEELRAYLDATRPVSVSLLPDREPGTFLLGPNAPDYAHWVAVTTWSGPSPRAWPSDEPISIQLLRPNGSDRWTIVSAGKSERTTLSRTVQSSGGLDVLAGDVRAYLADEQDRLAFVPLIPSSVPADGTRSVRFQPCGLAVTPCIEYMFASRGILLRVFQGPAGCCLDNDRPDARRDVEIRPGVTAQFDPVQGQFGGPILWWVEETARGRAFVAVSSPSLGRDELIAIARSMTPITRIP